jgi:hypothetical protein
MVDPDAAMLKRAGVWLIVVRLFYDWFWYCFSGVAIVPVSACPRS